MPDSDLLKKLRILPDQRLLVLNAPPGYLARLSDLPAGATLDTEVNGAYDFVHCFVKNSDELARMLPVAQQAVKYDALLWLSYPKQSAKTDTDLSRDRLWKLVLTYGLSPVMQISIDDVWSALRFRPSERVGS